MVPEGAVAEAGDDGEIGADILDGAADRAASYLTLEFLQRGHEEFGIVPARRSGWPGCAYACGGTIARRVRLRGRFLWRACAALDEVDVAAGCRAGEQHTLE